jgi:ADP-heptose:LPS heptosyltransferase
MKTKLNSVTLVCIDCYNYGDAITAIRNSMDQCDFASVKFITDIEISLSGVEVVKIPKIKSKIEYSKFLMKDLNNYFDTDFALVIQHDGYVLCGDAWNVEFLNYDYIGAPWLYPDNRNVGNGGFSLRSKKLQTALAEDDFVEMSDPEDEAIGRLYREYLESKYDIKFPSVKLADTFSYELRTPICKTFGFHGKFHKPFQKIVRIKRTAAMGDVIMVEPVLEYFHRKGYRVVLETLPQFYLLFIHHHYKVYRPEEIDNRVWENAEYESYNLDMSYESKPDVLRLKTYYEFCGVSDGEMKNPKLSLSFKVDDKTRLFPKYCIIHLENKAESGRNVRNVAWELVISELKLQGYFVVQVGRDESIKLNGATQIRTMSENFLAYVIAGADLFIGIDSGPAHIASGFGIPSILFFGNVNPKVAYPDLSNKYIITNHEKETPICDKPYCWHTVVNGIAGAPCYIDQEKPPCTSYKAEELINAITDMSWLNHTK